MLVRLCSKWKLATVQLPIAYYRWHQNNTGYKTDFQISDELDIWLNEIKENENYNKLSNFTKFERHVEFYSLLKLLYSGKKWESFCKKKTLTLKQWVKFLIVMFLPTRIFKMLINRM